MGTKAKRSTENVNHKHKQSGGTKKGKQSTKGNTVKNALLTLAVALVIPLLAGYLFVGYYYKNHFYSKTEINGIDTSNMTTDTAEEAIEEEVADYTLTITGRNGLSDTITGDEIGLHTVFARSLPELMNKQNSFTWPTSMFQRHDFEIKTMLKFDEALLKEAVKKLVFLDPANITEPVNASISEYGPNGYELIPEDAGTTIKEDKLYEVVLDAANTLQTSVNIDEAGCYIKPEITFDNPELLKALSEMNKLAGARITYQFGDATEVLDGSTISKWISVDKDFKVQFYTEGIKEYVDYIGRTYNSFGRVREFKTTYGDVIKVSGGDYGWWLNRPSEVEELTTLIQNGEQLIKTPVYFQTAQQYGPDDIGDTYVEVNLTAQHLFFYKDGELILDTDFVSGNVSKELGTPTGTYPVQYKDNDATLVGEDYATPVKYWMPFNKNIGFHDASWRKEFGKDIYLTNGSHGCINMPPKMAKKMFQYIERGVAVVVYELPGTENYEVKPEQNKPGNTADTENTDGSQGTDSTTASDQEQGASSTEGTNTSDN